MVMSAEYRSKFAIFAGYGDVSIWAKNSRVGQKKNPKTNKKKQIQIQFT